MLPRYSPQQQQHNMKARKTKQKIKIKLSLKEAKLIAKLMGKTSESQRVNELGLTKSESGRVMDLWNQIDDLVNPIN